ncbi:Imm32 family immunity protein [Ramlibacter humi]|uniref:Uncharacterized protein n=1 Tax=Ramlibacter humi TaxID=2530451 RepID=A0A4Z0C7L5_9BURK|nr:hypothetical protein [Ramlibacter humi]TFZ07656.1 hypothetical protein EZ216_00365 [Ramlibacter humi]
MKIFGYPAGAPLNDHGLVELEEVSFAADADALRLIAAYLLSAADGMDAAGAKFGHVHAQDEVQGWSATWPDVIVARGDR